MNGTNTSTSTTPTTGIMKCPACLTQTNFLINGLCLECAWKKLQIDMHKNSPTAYPNYGQAWICPKCGMVHGPSSQTCWCSGNKVTYGGGSGIPYNGVFGNNVCINESWLTPEMIIEYQKQLKNNNSTHQVTQDMFVPIKENND